MKSNRGFTVVSAIVAVGLSLLTILVVYKSVSVNQKTSETISETFEKIDLQDYLLRKVDCQMTSALILKNGCNNDTKLLNVKGEEIQLPRTKISTACRDQGTHWELLPRYAKKDGKLINVFKAPHISCTKNPCIKTTHRFSHACMHVIHRGSSAAADAINKNLAPQWEQSCEVNFNLKDHFSIDELMESSSIEVEWTSNAGSPGKSFPDGYSGTWSPGNITTAPAPNSSSRTKVLASTGKVYSVNVLTPKKAVNFVEYEDVSHAMKIRIELNGWGNARYDFYTNAYINEIDVTIEHGQCGL